MSNNCFKRKLMSVVDDSSLDKLGEIKIVVPANVNNSYQIGCVAGKSIQIYSDSPVLSLDGSTYVDSITISSVSVRWWLNTTEETVINITNKYYLHKWGDGNREGLGWIDLSVFEYSQHMVAISLNNQQGVTGITDFVKNLSELAYFNVPLSCIVTLSDFRNNNVITTLSGKFVGDTEELRGHTTIQDMRCNNAPDFTGNIKDFGLMTSLNSCSLFQCPGITGNVEEFVAIQRGAGRTQGSIGGMYTFCDCNIYFNGAKVPSVNGGLSWTATTITFKGVTIDNDDVITPE